MQRRRMLRVILHCWLTLASCLTLPAAFAAPKTPTEYDIKAAFLYNFIKFIDWPEEKIPTDTNQPIIIGIIGEDLFKDSINIIKGEKAKSRDIVIKFFECEHKSKESDDKTHTLSAEKIEALRKALRTSYFCINHLLCYFFFLANSAFLWASACFLVIHFPRPQRHLLPFHLYIGIIFISFNLN